MRKRPFCSRDPQPITRKREGGVLKEDEESQHNCAFGEGSCRVPNANICGDGRANHTQGRDKMKECLTKNFLIIHLSFSFSSHSSILFSPPLPSSQMAELQNILNRAAQVEADLSSLYGKHKGLRKMHDTLEHMSRKQHALAQKRAKVRDRSYEGDGIDLAI